MIKVDPKLYQFLFLFPIFPLFGKTNMGILVFYIFSAIICLFSLIRSQKLKITTKNSILMALAAIYAIASALLMENFYGFIILLLALLANREAKPGLLVISIFNIMAVSSLIFLDWYLSLGKNSISTFLTIWVCYNYIFFRDHRRLVLFLGILVKVVVYQTTQSDVLLLTSFVCLVGILLNFRTLQWARFILLMLGILGFGLGFSFLANSVYFEFLLKDPRLVLYAEFIGSFLNILTFSYTPSSVFNLYSQFHNPILNIIHWGGIFGLLLAAFIAIRAMSVISRGGNVYSVICASLLARAATDSIVLYTPEGLLFYSALMSNRKDGA